MKNRISAFTRYPSDPVLACKRAHEVIDFCDAIASLESGVPIKQAHIWMPLELLKPYGTAHNVLRAWETEKGPQANG